MWLPRLENEDTFNIVAESEVTLSPEVMWELESISNTLDDLIKEFSVTVFKLLLDFVLLFIVKYGE